MIYTNVSALASCFSKFRRGFFFSFLFFFGFRPFLGHFPYYLLNFLARKAEKKSTSCCKQRHQKGQVVKFSAWILLKEPQRLINHPNSCRLSTCLITEASVYSEDFRRADNSNLQTRFGTVSSANKHLFFPALKKP